MTTLIDSVDRFGKRRERGERPSRHVRGCLKHMTHRAERRTEPQHIRQQVSEAVPALHFNLRGV